MNTSTDPKAIDPAEHTRRLRETELRVAEQTAQWIRSRTELLTTSFLAVATVRERCEEVANAIWATDGLSYEVCEKLTELVFAIAKPPAKRTMSNERNRIPADPLLIANGIAIATRDASPDASHGTRTSIESTSTADA